MRDQIPVRVRADGSRCEARTYSFDRSRCDRETDAALLVNDDWIPKAAVHEDSDVQHECDRGTLVLHAWWVERDRCEEDPPPDWWAETPPRGRDVPTPEVLKNRPLRPPGRS